MRQAVMWIENYARRIESLSTRNVDPELIEYGNYVAQSLRAIVNQAYGLSDKLDAAYSDTADVKSYTIGYLPTARTVNYGGYFERMYAPFGYANIDPNAGAEKQQQTEDEVYRAMEDARQTLAQLVVDNETVRKKLTEQYGLAF